MDAFFHRRQIIGDAPRQLLSIRGELNAADQVGRGLEPEVDFSRESFVERILYYRSLFRRQVKRAAHERRSGGSLKSLTEASFCLSVHLSQAAREHLSQAFFQTRRSEICKRLSRNGKYFQLGPAADCLT